MNKQEFLDELQQKLCGLPNEEINERLSFYSEIIDDRIEDGILEEDAIKELGDIDEIAKQIINETPLFKIVKENVKPKKIGIFELILLILGSPIWLSILISLFSAFVSIYLSLWAVIASLWAVAIAFGAATFGLLVYGIITIIQGNVPTGIAALACCCIVCGFSIYFDIGCKWASKGIIILTKKFALWIKKLFIKREGV